MATHNLTTTPQEIQSKTIEISGRLFQIARVTEYCWLLTDLATGDTKQFAEAPAMWKYIGTIKALVPDMSVPQLPERVPVREVPDRKCKKTLVFLRACYVRTIPTRGVICLPATTTPEPPKPAAAPPLTGAQQRVADQFLDNATEYFNALCAMDNAPLTHRERRGLKWKLDCAYQNMNHKAFTYYQMVSSGAF